MEIINLPEAKSRKYSSVLDTTKTYYFIQVVHAFEVPNAFDSIPKEIIDFINHGDIYLIISNEFECFDTVVEEIYNYILIPNKIPENKIVFLSGAVEISTISKNITNKVNTLFKTSFVGIDSRYFCWFEYAISYYYLKDSNRSKIELKRDLALQGKLNYKKKYLLFNNRWRFHRPTLIALLKIKNLLDHGYISLGSNDGNYNWQNVFEAILDCNRTNEEIYNLLLLNKQDIQTLSDLVLDVENKSSTDYNNYNYSFVAKYFENSFMSVVTETYFYGTKTKFLSEKTFKPIAFLQPFILVSVPYSLEVLRNLGYKTFHPYINESYDIEENDAVRMKMIVDEIERLSNLSETELKKLSKSIRDVCIHNQKLLLSRSK